MHWVLPDNKLLPLKDEIICSLILLFPSELKFSLSGSLGGQYKLLMPGGLLSTSERSPDEGGEGVPDTKAGLLESSGHNESLNESIVTLRPRVELSDALELPPELVKHLFKCV
jgi:hypothetical protein